MRFILQVLTAIFLLTLPASAATITQSAPEIPPPAEIPVPPAAADLKSPVESLDSAIENYKAGNYNQALDAIDEARKAINEKHLSLYAALLPPAPAGGWGFSDKPYRMTSNVSRDYSANGQTVTLSFSIDKNMIQFASNRVFNALLANSNQTSFPIKGNNAIYQETKVGDKILMYRLNVYTDNALVTVQSATIGKDTLVKFAELIDYDKLKALK